MLRDLEHPAQVAITGRARHLHPHRQRSEKKRRMLWTALFFGSITSVLAFLIWMANRDPAPPPPTQRPPRGLTQ
jgi:hypothetical protein